MFKSIRKPSRAHEATVVQITTFVAFILQTHLHDHFLAGDNKQYWHTAVVSLIFGLCHRRIEVAARKRNALRSLTDRAQCPDQCLCTPSQHSSGLSCIKIKSSRMQIEFSKRKGKDQSRLLVLPLAHRDHSHQAPHLKHRSDLFPCDSGVVFSASMAAAEHSMFHTCALTQTLILVKYLLSIFHTQNLRFRHEPVKITGRVYALCYSIFHTLNNLAKNTSSRVFSSL